MKTLNELQLAVTKLNLTNPTFLVQIREDEWENTSDANYSESNEFIKLEEAIEHYTKELENISTFQSSSEYKELELVVTTDDGDFEVLESELFRKEYTAEDYGKFLISYRPTNNGIEGVEVEVINKYTEFQVSADGRYSTKFQVEDTKEDAIKFIYDKKLYMSMDECEELFEMALRK